MTGAKKELFGIIEKVRSTAMQIFGQAPMPRPSQRRTLSHGNYSMDSRNLPNPWQKREWSATRNIGNLPSVIDSGISGPSRTMYGQQLYPLHKSEAEYRSQVENFDTQEVFAIGHQSKGVGTQSPRAPYRSRDERLASGAGSENQTAALDFVRKHPGRGTDVLPDTPYPRPMPLSGQSQFQFPILRSIARRMGL